LDGSRDRRRDPVMRWIIFFVLGLAAVIAAIAAVGAMLPRAHKASRTLRLHRAPADVWPVVTEKAQASSVPVDVLENNPPASPRHTRQGNGAQLRRHVDYRSRAGAGPFDGLRASGVHRDDHGRRLGSQPDLPVHLAPGHRSPRNDGRAVEAGGENLERGRCAVRGVTTRKARKHASQENTKPISWVSCVSRFAGGCRLH